MPSVTNITTKVVLSLDINTFANDVYRFNFPNTNQQSRNIESLSVAEVDKLQPDVIMMSPPCQPFTRVGNKLDIQDPRCSSFLHVVEILPQLSTVTYILMENVMGFESSQMRNLFVQALKSKGMFFREFLISPELLDIPNSRMRYYLLARKLEDFSFGVEGEIVREMPPYYSREKLILPEKQRSTSLASYLEDLNSNALNEYLLSDKTLLKYCFVLDIRRSSDFSSCCFTKAYSKYAEGTGSVLHHDTSSSLKEQFTLFEKDGNVSHLKQLQLRYFTPREVSNLMGFPQEFAFPDNISNRTRYRLLGNSLNVVVVSNLIQLLAGDANKQ